MGERKNKRKNEKKREERKMDQRPKKLTNPVEMQFFGRITIKRDMAMASYESSCCMGLNSDIGSSPKLSLHSEALVTPGLTLMIPPNLIIY